MKKALLLLGGVLGAVALAAAGQSPRTAPAPGPTPIPPYPPLPLPAPPAAAPKPKTKPKPKPSAPSTSVEVPLPPGWVIARPSAELQDVASGLAGAGDPLGTQYPFDIDDKHYMAMVGTGGKIWILQPANQI